jgi:hypothetical protein
MKKTDNTFWAVYNEKGRCVSIYLTEEGAKEGALDISKYRWSNQTFGNDWKYLLLDGYKIKKSVIKPLDE